MAEDGQNAAFPEAVKIEVYFHHEKKGTICIVRPHETSFTAVAPAYKGLKKQDSNINREPQKSISAFQERTKL